MADRAITEIEVPVRNEVAALRSVVEMKAAAQR